MVEGIGKTGMKLVAHPAAFRKDRVLKVTEDFKISMPKLEKDQIEAAGVELVESAAPYPMFDQTLCFLGGIPRKTEFEKGSVTFHYQESGEEKWDPIDDDTSLVAHVRGKGLVILSGCAHAGIVNTVEYAKEQTGVDQLFAVMGGFHLTGKEFAPIIEPTAMALKELIQLISFPPIARAGMRRSGFSRRCRINSCSICREPGWCLKPKIFVCDKITAEYFI